MKTWILFVIGLVFFLNIFIIGCSTQPQPPSLYTRLGGDKAIVAVVQDLSIRLVNDPRVKKYFVQTSGNQLRLFKQRLYERICIRSGGPCMYQNETVALSTEGMKISDKEFSALLEDLSITMNKLNIGQMEQREIMTILTPLRKDIVEI